MFGVFAFGQVLGELFVDDVVRGRGLDLFEIGAGDHAQVPVTEARIEADVGVVDFGLEVGDQLGAFVGGDVAGAVVGHLVFVEGDQIAAEDPVVALEADALSGGLEGGAAGVVLAGIVTEQGHLGDIAAGRKTLGDRVDQALLAVDADGVDVRDIGGLEDGFSAEAFPAADRRRRRER